MADYVIVKGNVKTVIVNGKKPLISRFTSGEAITAGKTVVISIADSLAYMHDIADADKSAIVGMALNDCAAGQLIDIIVDGYAEVGAVATAGDVAVGSTSVGGLASWGDLVVGNKVSLLGFFVSSSLLKIDINNLGIPKG